MECGYLTVVICLTWVKYPSDHAWEDEHKQGQNFEDSTEQCACLSVGERFGCQSSLYNHLEMNRKRVIYTIELFFKENILHSL